MSVSNTRPEILIDTPRVILVCPSDRPDLWSSDSQSAARDIRFDALWGLAMLSPRLERV